MNAHGQPSQSALTAAAARAAHLIVDGQPRISRPVFVSWLGVTMYLDETAIEATVSVLGGFAPGSEIVVDYMLPAGLRDAAGQTYAELVGQFAAERGEPWLSVFTPEAMAALPSPRMDGSRASGPITAAGASWVEADPPAVASTVVIGFSLPELERPA